MPFDIFCMAVVILAILQSAIDLGAEQPEFDDLFIAEELRASPPAEIPRVQAADLRLQPSFQQPIVALHVPELDLIKSSAEQARERSSCVPQAFS